ncbi:MAG: glycosyltransferase family 2 protein [Thiobacillus sp.]|nr:glycosyltransferase family 2 protein [Thiobacillus sp.]
MTPLTVAFCTYNRADRLPGLVAALRQQRAPLPFDLLAVDNASTDATRAVLDALAAEPGAALRVVTESEQGIVPARNRALAESLDRDWLVFIDDDELPAPGWLAAACDGFTREAADCVGGHIEIDYGTAARPRWLDDEIAAFLGRLDHGPQAFWIESDRTPLWSGNTGYAMRIFREAPALRFDARYNRAGTGVGGGEDAMMFRSLLARGARMRYRPDMRIYHGVDPWKLRRAYFLRLHYQAGLRAGRYALPDYPRTCFGMPPFLLGQAARQFGHAAALHLGGRPGALRQAMNAAHALGCAVGYRRRA